MSCRCSTKASADLQNSHKNKTPKGEKDMITTEEIQYAKGLNELTQKYCKTHNFEDILAEAHQFNEDAFEDTIKNAKYCSEWKYYLEKCTARFRFLDIVDIAKVLRKELKKEFGKDIKFNIRTERGFSADSLWITIKPQNDKYLQPLDEYMEEYKRKYKFHHGIEHPYTNDEVFKQYSKISMGRLDKDVRHKIRTIIELFRMDNSDIMTDYFDCNYTSWYKLEVDGESNAGYTGIS